MSPEPEKVAVDVEGRDLVLTNLAKVLYPETGFTKGHVIDYYLRVAPVLLPHIAGRPLTLKLPGRGDRPALLRQARPRPPAQLGTNRAALLTRLAVRAGLGALRDRR